MVVWVAAARFAGIRQRGREPLFRTDNAFAVTSPMPDQAVEVPLPSGIARPVERDADDGE